MILKGINGQVDFDGKQIKITRKGLLTVLFAPEKTLQIADVVGVGFKEAGFWTNGYIQFSTDAHGYLGGLSDATQDENSVLFNESQQQGFAELCEAVKGAISEVSRSLGSRDSESPLDGLKKLKELLDSGVLSEEEYSLKKAKFMDQI